MKDTKELLEALEKCDEFEKYYAENSEDMTVKSVADLLNEIVAARDLNRTDIITKAEMSTIYGYQIFNGTRRPGRDKLICIALAMQLDLETVQRIFKSCGYPALYVKMPRDCVLIYGIVNKLSVMEINKLLFDYGQPCLV